jgi:hypothetical protein
VIFVFEPSEKLDDVGRELDKSAIPVQNLESPIKPHSSIPKSSFTAPPRSPTEHRLLFIRDKIHNALTHIKNGTGASIGLKNGPSREGILWFKFSLSAPYLTEEEARELPTL